MRKTAASWIKSPMQSVPGVYEGNYLMKSRLIALRLAMLAALSLSSIGVYAQAGQATLTGIATDASGALVAGAQVTLIQESTHTQRTAKAGQNGSFSFVAIPPDIYDVLVSAPGFRPARQNGIAVH